MSDFHFTAQQITAALEGIVDKVIERVYEINEYAIDVFYGMDPGTYNRAMGFEGLGKNPTVVIDEKGALITFVYSSKEVAVNSWNSPWGITYPGSPEYAFGLGFCLGSHGGPTPDGQGGWTFARTRMSVSPLSLILEGINSLSI